MDDQTNQGMPGPVPASPVSEVGTSAGTVPPAQPVEMSVGESTDDPHEKIIAALTRIESMLATIAAKVGV